MNLAEARAEAERYLAYLDGQASKAKRLAEIASARRSGEMNLVTARRKIRAIDDVSHVYDGSNLELAIRKFLDVTKT